jgi:hypothetical protein
VVPRLGPKVVHPGVAKLRRRNDLVQWCVIQEFVAEFSTLQDAEGLHCCKFLAGSRQTLISVLGGRNKGEPNSRMLQSLNLWSAVGHLIERISGPRGTAQDACLIVLRRE